MQCSFSLLVPPLDIAAMDCRTASPATFPPHGFLGQLCLFGTYVILLSSPGNLLYEAISGGFGIHHEVGRDLVREAYTQKGCTGQPSADGSVGFIVDTGLLIGHQ